MKIATQSTRRLGETKLLAIDALKGTIKNESAKSLSKLLSQGDVLVVNRAGTLPSRFEARHVELNTDVELRLAAFAGPSLNELKRWKALVYSRGDWRQTTEDREKYLALKPGDHLEVGDLRARVIEIDAKQFFVSIEFEGENLVDKLYRQGRPIQYSYLQSELKNWETQTLFAAAPIAVEAPSASFPITWQLLFELQNKGVEVVSLYHGAGISSTGDAELDRSLPLEEFYSIPEGSWQQLLCAREHGRRIVALGSSATRALETALGSNLQREGFTRLRLDRNHPRRVVDALITGMHEIGTSHLDMVASFCTPEQLEHALQIAEDQGYRTHEFGDLSFVDGGQTLAQSTDR